MIFSQQLFENLKKEKKVKLSNLEHFQLEKKNQELEEILKQRKKKISARNVVLFKPSKEFKKFINKND